MDRIIIPGFRRFGKKKKTRVHGSGFSLEWMDTACESTFKTVMVFYRKTVLKSTEGFFLDRFRRGKQVRNRSVKNNQRRETI